jgi:hypothetical protein
MTIFSGSCTPVAEEASRFKPYTVEVRVETEKGIEVLGHLQGSPNALGLAWPPDNENDMCIIMVPELTEDTRWIWEHELRHCTHGKYH